MPPIQEQKAEPLHPAAETVKQLDQTCLNFEHVKRRIHRFREVMPDVFPLMKLGRLDELGSYSPGKAEYEADMKSRGRKGGRRPLSPDSDSGRRSPTAGAGGARAMIQQRGIIIFWTRTAMAQAGSHSRRICFAIV